MASLLSISLTGLGAAQVGLQTVQHNVANASTAGYSRQVSHQATTTANRVGGQYIGNGTQVEAVTRQYDQFLTSQVDRAQTTLSALQAAGSQTDAIDGLLADPTSGVAPALADFFSAAQQVGAYPSSIAARQSLVSSAQVLANRFQSMEETVDSLNDQMNLRIETDSKALNAYAVELANLNAEVSRFSGSGAIPNDLLDRRDMVISEMGKLADITTTYVKTDTGQGAFSNNDLASIQVYVGQGHILVGDHGSYPVSAVRSGNDPTQFTFTVNGEEIAPGDVTGGSLGGLLSFRGDVLNNAQNALGQVAYALASTFNAQHATGMDLLGNQEGDANFIKDFFTVPTTGNAVGNPATAPALVFDLEPAVLTGDTTNDFYQTAATKSDFTLDFLGGQFTLTRGSDGHTWSGATITDINKALTDSTDAAYVGNQGFTLQDSGAAIADGTKYTIRPMALIAGNIKVNEEIAGDVRKFAAGLAVTAHVPVTNNGYMTALVTRMTNGDPTGTVDSGAPLTLTYNAGNLTGFPGTVNVTNLNALSSVPMADPVPFQAGASYSINGIVFTMSGQPQDGDQIILQRNDEAPIGVSDSSNMLLMGKLETSKTIAGSTTYNGAYAQMVAEIGNKASTLKINEKAQQTLLDTNKSRRDAISGVNLDEEASNLLYYQQMYQANAKALQAGQKLFDVLLSLMG